MDLKAYIIQEADLLFCQYGFKSVTMDDIAKKLGMSKKTIYQHFSDKDELVNILIKEKLEMHDCVMKNAHQDARNAVDEIFYMLQSMNDTVASMNPKLFYDLQKYHTKAWIYFRDFRKKAIYEAIQANLRRGIEEGVYRPEINVEILTQLRLDQIDLIFSQNDQYTMNKYNLGEIMVELSEHFLYGVCSEKGIKAIKKNKEKNTAERNSN